MRQVLQRRKFFRDLTRQIQRGKDIEELFSIVRVLAQYGRLPEQFRPHKLSGKYEGLWECHIAHDWLLIYEITDDTLILARTGTHADLFE